MLPKMPKPACVPERAATVQETSDSLRHLIRTKLRNYKFVEFVASQVDWNGVLMLSQFTGAARELRDAVIINHHSPEGTAQKVHEAIEMETPEVRKRMGGLRAQVRENNIYKWAADIMRKLTKLA
jgi:trehalose-6-phosphate synthase